MTIDDVKDELKAYKDDCKLIESIEDQISLYTSKLTSCTAEINDMPKGSRVVQDRMAEYIAKIQDLKADKYLHLIEIENKKQLIEKTILRMEQPFKTLLHITYIDGKSLTETASKMGYTYKHICKLHGKALIEYMKVRENDATHETSKKR